MKIRQIQELTRARLVCGQVETAREVAYGFASDLMSDVLRLDVSDILLITGLCNIQTIRTAEMADVNCILFVRGKMVTREMEEVASDNNMVLLTTDYSMYRAVGLLYGNGLKPAY